MIKWQSGYGQVSSPYIPGFLCPPEWKLLGDKLQDDQQIFILNIQYAVSNTMLLRTVNIFYNTCVKYFTILSSLIQFLSGHFPWKQNLRYD